MTANQTLDRHARASADDRGERVVVMATCAGTTGKGKACTTNVPIGRQYCYHHDPTLADERSNKASRAAKVKHDTMAKEIRRIREDIHEILWLTATNQIHPHVKNRLTEIVQLSQSYARLTELELTAGGKVDLDSIATDLPELVRQFIAAEEARQAEDEARRSEMQALTEEFIERHGWEGKKATSLRAVANM